MSPVPQPSLPDRAELERAMESGTLWGLCTSVDLFACDPVKIRDAGSIKRYVHELCSLIEMRRFGETVAVRFGEDERVCGFSVVQLIETSLISGHFAEMTNTAYIDIFSCKFYDYNVAGEFSKDFFKARDLMIQVHARHGAMPRSLWERVGRCST